MLSSIVKKCLDFIVPQTCLSCNSPTSLGILCETCANILIPTNPESRKNHFNECFAKSRYISSLFFLYEFEKATPIQDLLHKLKYENKFRIASFLGKTFADQYSMELAKLDLNGIIPVPLFHSKRAERGYNQTFYLAKGISKSIGIRLSNNVIKRIRFTDTQTRLSREERMINVEGAFALRNGKDVKLKNFLLVDDVLTTGSTISECAKVLKAAGANKVYAGTIAAA